VERWGTEDKSTEYGGIRRPCKGANRSGAPVQRWKGGGRRRGQSAESSTEYGGRSTERWPCKSAKRPTACAKVEKWKYEKGAKRGTGDRKVSAGGARVVRSRFGRHLANGRDAVAPLPEGGGREGQRRQWGQTRSGCRTKSDPVARRPSRDARPYPDALGAFTA
jgi:hypothetical protein